MFQTVDPWTTGACRGQPIVGLAKQLQLHVHLCLWLCDCCHRGAWRHRIPSGRKMVLFCCGLHYQQLEDVHAQAWRTVSKWTSSLGIWSHRWHVEVRFLEKCHFTPFLCEGLLASGSLFLECMLLLGGNTHHIL